VQALKHAKQFAGITRIETRAVVTNEDRRLTGAAGSTTDFDFGLARVPVNFTALEIRLTSTIRSKARSTRTVAAVVFHAIFRPLVSA